MRRAVAADGAPAVPRELARATPRAPVSDAGRRPIAVIVSRFPLPTEDSVLRELMELERRGQDVRLVPLSRKRSAEIGPKAAPWVERALFTPIVSPDIIAANVRALRRRPGPYLALLRQLVRRSVGRPGLLGGTLAFFPKAVFIAERLRAEGIGHVHARFATHPATVALVIERLAGIGFSFTAHAYGTFPSPPLLEEKVRRARFVRALSDFDRRLLEARHPESVGKIHLIPAGVEPDVYGDVEYAQPTSERAIRTILCVAALKPHRGITVLLEAARHLAEADARFRCLVIGDGPRRRRLEAWAGEFGLRGRVRFLGKRRHEEVLARLQSCDVFVLPGETGPYDRLEGIPVALLEALAAGRPVIASRLSGIPELVTDGHDGLLVPPGDAKALARAILDVLGDAKFARALGERGRGTVSDLYRLDHGMSVLAERFEAESGPPGGTAGEVIEAVEWSSRPLDELIRRYRIARDLEPLCRAFHGAGLWLGRFQRAPVAGRSTTRHLESVRHPERVLGRELERRLGVLQHEWPGAPLLGPLASGVSLEGLRRLVAAAAAQSGPPVPCHRDFRPGNVRVDGSTVRLLDPESHRGGCAWENAGTFLAHAESYFLVGPRSRFRRLEEAFMEGFLEGRGNPWPAPAALLLCRATAMARLLTAGARRTPREWLKRLLLARRLTSALAGLEPSRPVRPSVPDVAAESRASGVRSVGPRP